MITRWWHPVITSWLYFTEVSNLKVPFREIIGGYHGTTSKQIVGVKKKKKKDLLQMMKAV